jgi:hypothetical protein
VRGDGNARSLRAVQEGTFMQYALIALGQSLLLTGLLAGIVLGIEVGAWALAAICAASTAVMALA